MSRMFISYSIHSFRTLAAELAGGSEIFFKFAEQQSLRVKYIVISKGTEFLRVPEDGLMYVSADGNYSNVVTLDGRSTLVSLQLGQVEDLIAEQFGDKGGHFLRVGRGLIVNVDYLFLIDVARQRLVLSDCRGSYHDLTASREVLSKLKVYFESLSKAEYHG